MWACCSEGGRSPNNDGTCGGKDVSVDSMPALRLLLTISFDKRMSTQSVVNSQTSRKSTLMACARASASSTELISKRKTKSPPYLARSVGGGRTTAGSLRLAFAKFGGGERGQTA